ncbi:hypothetical protein PENARI_c016G02816 [Penicillium arizonense]|uniref:Uncharacterized protein n=1 Tax=Penicillium arizonense TaxID=1835702 RepID=A0A1F5LBT5_PENAI|nr:hypothetical protein PENARI_c016G02816 [Penicillium arizonense]OGE50516.1 hypothetical protein PENARI_c016G02816 [Penicillium arizonense]
MITTGTQEPAKIQMGNFYDNFDAGESSQSEGKATTKLRPHQKRALEHFHCEKYSWEVYEDENEKPTRSPEPAPKKARIEASLGAASSTAQAHLPKQKVQAAARESFLRLKIYKLL